MLCSLDPFFILIYKGSKYIRVRRNDKEGIARYPTLDKIENNNDLSSYCGRSELMLILGQSLTSELESGQGRVEIKT